MVLVGEIPTRSQSNRSQSGWVWMAPRADGAVGAAIADLQNTAVDDRAAEIIIVAGER